MLELVEDHLFFTLHAGRQTGKTTSLRWLEGHLNATGQWRAVWLDLETARDQDDVSRVMTVILTNLDRVLSLRLPELSRPDPAELPELLTVPESALLVYLGRLAALDPRPLVMLLDEADGVVGSAMVSMLTQLRQGYIERPEVAFPASVVLVGQRQVRDYVLRDDDRRAITWLGTTSPFNVTTEALTLAAFTEAEVAELLQQHTEATGQRFEPEASARIYELGQGHPWLTNALADQIVRNDVTDRSVPITAAHVEAAKQTIILERRTHIDSLVARLREPRVQRIIAPMIVGERTGSDVLDDDFSYLMGLGLIRRHGGQFEVANPIYREVIPRALIHIQQHQINHPTAWYVRDDGSLDVPALMSAWQTFWRKDGHMAAAGFGYREAGPHLMLMAFLQRVVNGGGRIEREYGLGRGALDLLVEWNDERHAIEVKLRRDTETELEALDQVTRYLDALGTSQGWLVLFDLRTTPGWSEKLYVREVEHRGKTVRIVGC